MILNKEEYIALSLSLQQDDVWPTDFSPYYTYLDESLIHGRDIVSYVDQYNITRFITI